MSLLFSPLTLTLLVLLIALIALAGRRRVLGVLLLLAALLPYLLMTPFGANRLVLHVEQRIEPFMDDPACENPQAMVLLSGGLKRPAVAADDFDALSAESLSRIFAYVRSAPPVDLPLVVAGGSHFDPPDAAVIGALLDALGHLPEQVYLETTADTTYQSAHATPAVLPAGIERVRVATGALHLPRAAWSFRQAGLEVCPQPLHSHYIPATGWLSLLPRSSALAKSESALHEVIGDLVYRNRRVSELGARDPN